MTLDFLSVDLARPDTVARSPLEPDLRPLGARLAVRDGWSTVEDFGDKAAEREAARTTVALGDRSPLGKLEAGAPAAVLRELVTEVGGGQAPAAGAALAAAGAWWCRVTPERMLVLCPPSATRRLRERLESAASVHVDGAYGVVDLTCELAAIGIAGPRARAVLARMSALDLRPDRAPEGAFRAGSVARVPAMVLREARDAYLLLFGSAHAHYMWAVVRDAAEPLGGRPAGAHALEAAARA